MKTHDDIGMAIWISNLKRLPKSVIRGIEVLQKEKGFPDRTIGPKNPHRPQEGPEAIDWNIALTQVASWSVAGTIQPMDRRFEDLKTRHARTPDSPKKLTEEELDHYHEWGQEQVAEISRHVGIDPEKFFPWLKAEILAGEDPFMAQIASDALIRKLFDREPKEDEFLPISPAYRYLAESIMGKRKNVSGKDLIANPEEALRRFAGHGVIKETGDIYSADKPRWEKEFDAYAEQFSELESLQGVIETNPWHDHDDAFTHTRNVYKNVVHDLQFTFVTNKEKRRALKEYFDAPFAEDFMTRAEGVKIAVMLHDITKSDPQEMTIEEGTGHTYFPTHHASGAQMASAILEGKQYTPAFVQRVRTLIGLHTQIHLMEDSSQRQARMEQIQANNPDIFPDLLILSMADMQGSDLAKLNVMDYEERMKDYITAFNNLHI